MQGMSCDSQPKPKKINFSINVAIVVNSVRRIFEEPLKDVYWSRVSRQLTVE